MTQLGGAFRQRRGGVNAIVPYIVFDHSPLSTTCHKNFYYLSMAGVPG
jgi:hypothetical protein